MIKVIPTEKVDQSFEVDKDFVLDYLKEFGHLPKETGAKEENITEELEYGIKALFIRSASLFLEQQLRNYQEFRDTGTPWGTCSITFPCSRNRLLLEQQFRRPSNAELFYYRKPVQE
uniref:Uncharacterized protein n=1 Tax=Meloidogyne incognita TaxID=6306 RepID=A0A914LJM5_MELIC